MDITIAPASLKVEPATIRAYAELTRDFNPIHLDRAFAESTSMGGVIAHGTLSMCLLWQALRRTFGERIFGDQVDLDIRFLKPVREGETLIAGGQSIQGSRDCFEVWVRGDDGTIRVSGNLRLPALKGGET